MEEFEGFTPKQIDVLKQGYANLTIHEGGTGGGTIVAKGTPEEVAQVPESYTGQFVKEMLEKK